MSKRANGSSRLLACLAAALVVAGLPVSAQAETPPGRPADKPAAEGATPRIRVLQSGNFRPEMPPVSAQMRPQPLTPAQRRTFFNTDTGAPYVKLDVATPVVPGKGALGFDMPLSVRPAERLLTFARLQGTQPALVLMLRVEPKRFYFIDVMYWASGTDATCGFDIVWPDKGTDHMACHPGWKQHLLFGFQAPATGDRAWLRILPKQATGIY